MSCKIQIKQNITQVVEEKTSGATQKNLLEAKAIGKTVNAEFGVDVVSFTQTPGYDIMRTITIPDSLVDTYYEHELSMEAQESTSIKTDSPEIMLQTNNMPVSKANSETLVKVKKAMLDMGVSYQLLHDYAKSNPDVQTKDVNGLADLSAGVIAIAQGTESATLTEEMVHIATAILEQTDPKLITNLISKIERFKIYKLTYDAYKNNKNYQLSNGKPDIRKIKKEAVDKLIAEYIVNNSEGSTDFPELSQKIERNMIQEWWNTILEYIRSLYGKSKVDLFSQAADHIMSGNIGTIEDIKAQGTYFQIGNNAEVDKFVNIINDIDSRMKLNPKTVNDKRHYTFDEKTVARSVTEKIAKNKNMPDRTPEQKIGDDQKKEWGSEGHRYVEQYILTNLIDKDGFKKPYTDTPINSALDNEAQEKLNRFAENLIDSYPEGTRFLIEKKVINQREKGMLASTIDFLAIFPTEKKDGTPDVGVDILDWKFTDIDKSREEDIPWFKQRDWKPQMGEYTKILYEYGFKPGQIKKARMIPFIMNYDNVVKGDSKSGLRPTSIEIGKLDSLTETNLYLLPVPINSETTGNDVIDDLLKSLRSYWEKLYSKQVSPEARATKMIQLNQLSKSIRTLHVTLNFAPLVSVGRTFVSTSRATLDTFKGIDYTQLSKEQIEAKLKDLIEFKNTALNFTILDEAFISQYGDTDLSEETNKVLLGLKAVSANAKTKIGEILELQKEYVAQIAIRENFVDENNKTSLFDAEREIGALTKNFVEGSRLPAKLINFASNLIMRVKRAADKRFITKFDEFKKVLIPLEEEAARQGKSAFDLIGIKMPSLKINSISGSTGPNSGLVRVNVDNHGLTDGETVYISGLNKIGVSEGKYRINKVSSSEFDLLGTDRNDKPYTGGGTVSKNNVGLQLIKKIDKTFWKDVTAAKEKGKENKKFLMDNMDMDKFKVLAKEAIDKGIAELSLIEFSMDKDQNDYIRNGRIKRLRNSIDITRKDFHGYNEYLFNHIFRQVVQADKHLSEDYKRMAQNKASLDAWNFFTAMNEKARDIGYIDKQGMSFFPLVEASIVDKFRQTNNMGTEFKDFFKDLYSVKTAEEQFYSKKDSETGEVKKSIPKYFTKKGNLATEKLSTDLNKVGALWIKSLMDYEARQSIENTLLTIQAVEKAKGSLIVNDQGDLISEGGKFLVNKVVNKNANIMEAIINDALYDLQEDLGNIGNISIQKVANKFGTDAEAKDTSAINIKKGLRSADTLTRALAVGLKPLIGLANWMGYNVHAFINGGNMYTIGEFAKNNLAVTTGVGLTLEDKALLHYATTAPEDEMTAMRRKAAREKGIVAYLSTWSFTDVMMITNSFPERKLALANAKSFNDNAIIIDGKIVNARQYLKKQDRANKYKLSSEARRTLEKSFDSRVKDLIDSSTKLTSAVRITDDNISIEGVSEDEIVKYSLKVSEFARNLNGSMNDDNKAAYRRDTLFSSFMMFKNWIPKLLLSRTGEIKYNVETEDWEYGRMRALAKVTTELGLRNIGKLRGIITGSEEGLTTLRAILDSKKQEYFEKTGQELEITEEEFFDLMRREINNEMKELGMLLTFITAAATVGFMKPPEDATNAEKNKWKLWAKASNKISEELSFYYLPTSAESITKGSIIPSLGLLSKTSRFLNAFAKEAYGYTTEDQELMDKTYPIKYFFNLIPGLAQFQTDYLPYIDAELAKEMGIRVTVEARRQ